MDVLEILKSIFYGIVEGITEWLPISSTGHMILLEEILPMNVSASFWEVFSRRRTAGSDSGGRVAVLEKAVSVESVQ